MSGIAPISSPLAPVNSLQDTGYDMAVSSSASQLAADASASPSQGTTDIDKLSTDFEAVFLSQMMGAMFSGEELTAYFGGGAAGEIYKSFLMDQYGRSIAKSGGIGIATEVKKELLTLQEVS